MYRCVSYIIKIQRNDIHVIWSYISKNRKEKFVLIYFLTLKLKLITLVSKIFIYEKYNRSQLFSYYFL